MRAYVSFEDGIKPEDKGLVAIAFVCLGEDGKPVDQIDLTSEAHKMAGRFSEMLGDSLTRVVPEGEFAKVAALAVEAERLGILKPDEVTQYMAHQPTLRLVERNDAQA